MYWKGSNKLWCRKKVLFGSSWIAPFTTLFVINGGVAMFMVFVMPYFVEHYSIGMVMIPIYFIIATNMLFVWGSTMDPGILPRRITRMHKRYADEEVFYRIRNLSDNYRMKFWSTCFIFRPPRTSHCNTCNNWVTRWDHHWPWMGTCIGRRNFKIFYWMLVHLFFLALYGFLTTLVQLFLVASDMHTSSYNHAWAMSIEKYPMSLVICICISPGLVFVSVLLIYHTYLCMIEETTNENVKQYYSGVPFTPYSTGSYVKNLIFRVFESTPESLLTPDLRIRDKISIHETKMALERKLCRLIRSGFWLIFIAIFGFFNIFEHRTRDYGGGTSFT